MTDRLEHARRLGSRIDAGWRREDVEAQLARLHARRRRARRRAIALPIVAVLAIAGGLAIPRARVAAVPAPPVAVAPAPVAVVPTVEAQAPVIAPTPARPAAVVSPRVVPVAPHVEAHDAPPAPTTWRDAARRDDYDAAWRGLASPASLDRMEDLLLAGDVARLSGHADAALAPLGRAVELHPEDPRAPLAAFTLGRVHLEDLGAPRAAAQAFARARELAPGGPLAEDALAREVEAWSRAGESETARARARLYLERYPHGRRVHAVRRFGGVEAP